MTLLALLLLATGSPASSPSADLPPAPSADPASSSSARPTPSPYAGSASSPSVGSAFSLAVGAITEVVVYPDRARITRQQEVRCAADRTVATFAGLPGAADVASFRAFSRDATVLDLRARPRARATAFTGRAQALERQLRELADAIAAAEQRQRRLEAGAQARGQYLDAAERLVGQQLLRGQPDLPAWSAALNTALDVELQAERTGATLGGRLRVLKARRSALEQQRSELGRAGSHTDHTVEITLACSAPGTGTATVTVTLTYLVTGAGWSPAYEARARARDAIELSTGHGAIELSTGHDAAIELSTLATVQQTTGEDWRVARLVLSTALPREEATLPALRPVVVLARDREDDDRRIVARSEEVTHAAGAGALPAGATGTAIRADAQGLSVQMTLPHPPVVPGDGRDVRVEIGRTRQPAAVQLRTVPALSPHVFRIAELVNNTPFPLLPAGIDIYEDGAFVARDRIDETPVRGKLTVTLGFEPRVQVRRQIVRDQVRAQGFLGRAQRQEVGYRYVLVSHLPATTAVELWDRVPVSELRDVRVTLAPGTTAGHRIDSRDGRIRWALRLEPRVERRVELGFRIDMPAGYRP